MTPEDKALYLQTRRDYSGYLNKVSQPVFWLSGVKVPFLNLKPLKTLKFNQEKFRSDLIVIRTIERKISRREAANQIGIHSVLIQRLEKTQCPDVETFAKVCSWMETPMDDYFYSM